MKKILFAMFAIMLATVSFTSCEKDEETDAEILAKISNSVFSGKDTAGNTYTLTLDATNFTLIEPDGTSASYEWKGTYRVLNGRLILTVVSLDGDTDITGSFDLEIKGTTIMFPTYVAANETFTGPIVQLKKK